MDYDVLTGLAQPIVWRRGRRLGLGEADCEDLLQDVLTKYFTTWALDTPDNIEAWLETATKNAVIDRARAADRRPTEPFAEGGDDPLSVTISRLRSPRFASLQPIQKRILNEVFGLLGAAEADLLRERYLHNRSAADLAATLDITVANVDQRVSRAKKKLREALMERPDLVKELRSPHPRIY